MLQVKDMGQTRVLWVRWPVEWGQVQGTEEGTGGNTDTGRRGLVSPRGRMLGAEVGCSDGVKLMCWEGRGKTESGKFVRNLWELFRP